MQILVNNFIISYQISGKLPEEGGSAIVFLPGWGRTMNDFDAIRAHLEKTFSEKTYIQLDLPGFGGSPMEKDDGMSVTEYAIFLKNFFEKIGASRIILVGHSFGGKIAVKFCALFPRHVEKLVLISAAGLSRKNAGVRLAALGSSLFRILLFPFQHTKWTRRMKYAFRKLFGSSDYQATLSPALRETLKKNVRENSQKDAQKIISPTLIIWGEDDVVTPLKDGKKYHSLIHRSQFVVLPHCGHFSFLKYPEKCAKLIASFLENA